MQKQVVVRNEIITKLDVLREDHDCSYNAVIRLLLEKEPQDLRLHWINHLFAKLGIIVPEDMAMMVEVFRTIIVRTYLRDPSHRAEHQNTTDRILEKLIDDMIGCDNS